MLFHHSKYGRRSDFPMRLIPLLLLAGCTKMFEPSKDWIEYNPPQQYRVWHQEVERCIGTQRSFDDIVWRKVFARVFQCGNSDIATGCFARPNTIYIVERALNHGTTVKNELVHYIRQNGKHDALAARCARD